MIEAGTISSLNNNLWQNDDFMSLALIVEENVNSLKILPAHIEPMQTNSSDIILSSADSGLDFNLVVIADNCLSIPSSALGKSRMVLKENCRRNTLRRATETFKAGVPSSTGSNWRNNFILAFEQFRLNSWKAEFVKTVQQESSKLSPKTMDLIFPDRSKILSKRALGAKSSPMLIKGEAFNNRETEYPKLLKIALSLGLSKTESEQLARNKPADFYEKIVEFIKKLK